MEYIKTHVNDEKKLFKYHIVFVNPFVGAANEGTSLFLNSKVQETAEVAPFVKVTESVKPYGVIYAWDKTLATPALALTELATGEPYYILDDPNAVSVTYAWDEDNADYKYLTANMGVNSYLNLDTNTGTVTWKRVGNEYNRDLVLPVIATVTFTDLSVVECVIPVTFAMEYVAKN